MTFLGIDLNKIKMNSDPSVRPNKSQANVKVALDTLVSEAAQQRYDKLMLLQKFTTTLEDIKEDIRKDETLMAPIKDRVVTVLNSFSATDMTAEDREMYGL